VVTGTSRSDAHPKRESHGEVPRPQGTSWSLPLDRRRGGAFTTTSPAARLLAAEEPVAELTRPFLFLRRSACAAGATAGVKVRCEVVERDRHGRIVAKVFSPNGVDVGRRLVSAGGPGVPALLEGLCRRRGRGAQGQARDVAGHLRQTLGVAANGTAAAHAGARIGRQRQQAAEYLALQRRPIAVALAAGRRTVTGGSRQDR
jgi:hypothetical protein